MKKLILYTNLLYGGGLGPLLQWQHNLDKAENLTYKKKKNVDVHNNFKCMIMKILIFKIHQLELASFHMKIM